MKTVFAILLLALPIVCLLGGSVYCAVCLWKAHAKRADDFRLRQRIKADRVIYYHEENGDEKHNPAIVIVADDKNEDFAKICFNDGAELHEGRAQDESDKKNEIAHLLNELESGKDWLRPNKSIWIWLIYECLLYVLPIIVVPVISGNHIARYNISLREGIITIGVAVFAMGTNFLASVINPSKILSWFGVSYTTFTKRILIGLPVFLLGIFLTALCFIFFSQDTEYWFSSTRSVSLLSCAAISLLLIGNAVLSYTRKMLEYAEQR